MLSRLFSPPRAGSPKRPPRSAASGDLLTLCALGVFFVLVQTSLSWGRQKLDTISVEHIKPGMTGFGLSVFRGTKPERFPVEVIDVLHRFRPGQDLILVRTPHPLLNETKAVAGMSGSPIYLDGKLAGAYAYGWPFSTEPVVGVTPIANMLAELARPLDPTIWRILGPLPNKAEPIAQLRHGTPSQPPHTQGPLPAYRGQEPRDALWATRQLAKQQPNDAPGSPQYPLPPLPS